VAGALRHNSLKYFSTSPHIRRPQTPRFPPRELAKPPADPSSSSLTPETFGALQLPSDAALHAFASRIGLTPSQTPTNRIQQICTHPSFVPFYTQYNPQHTITSNGSLAALGNSLLGLFAAEHLHVSYPHLPGKAIKAAVTAYVGPTTCAAIAREFGASPLIRWKRTPSAMDRPALLLDDALASIPRSIIAVLYQDKSIDAARRFFNDHFISREFDMRSLLRFRDPKLSLAKTVSQFKREPPKSRLLSETGRLSSSPVFVVGIYSGTDKLGEGFGTSLKMAEYRAAEDALHRLYLTRQPPHLSQVPTSTFSPEDTDLFDPELLSSTSSSTSYIPSMLGHSEVLLHSSGRGGSRVEPQEDARGTRS